MSLEITTAFVNEYKSGIELLVQQMSARLRASVREETVSGKKASFDQVGVVAARRRTSRHADTPRVDTPHRRRWVTLGDYEISDLVDDQDKIRTLNDPTNAYSQTFAAALKRGMDTELVNGALGTSVTGEDGELTTVLPGGNKIAHGGTGMTLAKIKQAMQILKTGNAVDPNNGEQLTVAWTAKQEAEFIDQTEVKSVDYNTQRVLVQGNVDSFFGFNFLRLEDWTDELANLTRILPFAAGAPNVRTCLAWVKSGVLLGVGKDISGKITERPDKSYAMQVYACMTIGATRMQEPKVVQIDVAEI